MPSSHSWRQAEWRSVSRGRRIVVLTNTIRWLLAVETAGAERLHRSAVADASEAAHQLDGL